LLVADFPAGKFVTLVYAVLDPANRSVTFANAGHLQPLLVDDSGTRFLDTERGLPLGLSCGDYSQDTVALSPGSRLVFYSDGISEAVNEEEEEYGLDRLTQHVSRVGASAVSILDDVRAFAKGVALRDDASVVFVKAGP
jgi:sigma-B regulation protein RsbU (phosphoserine phosphatase)